ncbi:MAG: membrane protein insertase YidC [Sulfuricurvum sp.]|uniref:membrane protein insertase YidC n=1 Tax=Sulfuricurvum sp. TaxID=2025608 RepID=UPI00262DFB2D|nr:membrane protein insertase YidC [Sulfuricurvum sp.]MDD2828524.1 membrane protein insertase YidC [Sulfuricurvum sp.]MDD4948945.1 membrane protein insertase YidC [Sulfuricurvum sp.]
MLEKLSSNQRLLLAVALSFAFFIGYTTLFPPKASKSVDVNNTVKTTPSVATEVAQKSSVSPVETNQSDISTVKTVSSDTLTTINSKEFTLKIDTLGRIASFVLKNAKHDSKDGKLADLIPLEGAKPLQIRFADSSLDEIAQKTPYESNHDDVVLGENGKAEVVFTQSLPNLTISKKVTFFADGHYEAVVNLSDEKKYFLYLGQHPNINDKMMTVIGGMVYAGDNLTTIFKDGDVEGRTPFIDVHLVSAFDQYYATILYGFDKSIQVVVERDVNSNPVSYLEGTKDFSFKGYIGPKEYKTLQTIDPVLVNAIEFGWFTFIAAPIFKVLMWLHSIFGNWGWSIIALTALIRMVLYPLTQKGMVSMQKIKEIAPRIKEVQEKYKGDPQRMNAAVMEMYKKHGANPLGGCLPLLLQIPVFFAIYRVLLNAVELQGAPWILWVTDLSRMDPYYILPILMGATMYYQQKITPSNFTDPLQEKIFKFLPIIFTFFFFTFPAGLVLYWFINNIFSIAQQYLVNKQFEAARMARHEAHLAEKHHEKD